MTGNEKILIVEDDSIIAVTIEGRLKEFGYKVVGRAATGADAIKKALDLEPDLVLMDIHLKGPVDGIETAETIYGIHNIPVVYLTAFSDEATLERAQKTSPFGYIVKPFTDSTLKTTIRLALIKHKAEKKDSDLEDLMIWE
ncbi:MAG TPA: response regulator [Methanoregulaceae archaeon]|nr:response regulator [Methanoregulaceae archaeon]